MTTSCLTCAFYESGFLAYTPTGRLKRNQTARCLWSFEPVLPISVTTAPSQFCIPKRSMAPDEGDDCPTWEAAAPKG